MMNSPVRLRKVVRGYTMIRKIKVKGNTYKATIIKEDDAWVVTITDKDNEIVSQDDSSATKIEALDVLKGQLVTLGARFPVEQIKKVDIVPIPEPEPEEPEEPEEPGDEE